MKQITNPKDGRKISKAFACIGIRMPLNQCIGDIADIVRYAIVHDPLIDSRTICGEEYTAIVRGEPKWYTSRIPSPEMRLAFAIRAGTKD